ncbi:MAG TPA: two-component regulator propeller domain-containing protein, partial [Chitinophagaceae bacterium]
MKYFRHISAFIWLSIVAKGVCYSQFKLEKPVVITKEQGLPINAISSIKKGDDGFVWMATARGLCRFDGSQVKVFGEGNELRYSLFDHIVESVQPAGNLIWAGTHQGLSVLNTNDNTFRHYQLENEGKSDSLKRRYDQAINTLYKDSKNNIWIGTRDRGVCVYDKTKDDFRFFRIPANKYPPLIPSLGSPNAILNIIESRTNDSIVWAGTPSGLMEINGITGSVVLFRFAHKIKNYQVALNAFRRLYHHDDGLLYVGSWGAGVNVFNPITRSFTPLKVKNPVAKEFLTSVISNISRKSDHEIWITTARGLLVYDTRINDINWYKMNDAANYKSYAISFIDEANRIWSVDINGLRYFDPAMQQFSQHSFKHLNGNLTGLAFYVIPDERGNNITVCPRFADGFFRLNRNTNEWTRKNFPGNETFLNETDVIRGFVRLRSGDFVISSDKGLFIYNERQDKITNLERLLPFAAPTRRGEILLDGSDNLWICDDVQGLIKWRPGTNTYRFYKKELVWTERSLDSGIIESLYRDSKGNIWFQRASGVGVYLSDKDSILNFTATNQLSINSFAEDRNGRIWASGKEGWMGYGMVNDPYKGIDHKFNLREKGITFSFLHLAADKNGEIWGYTPKELIKINSDNLSFTSYSLQYGLNDTEFFHFSFLPSGEMVLGGRTEISIADPAELKRNTEIPAPYIDELHVANHQSDFIANGSPLRLTYKQNFFSIRYSAKAYTMPKDVRFRYRLKGFEDWTEITGLRFANYTNVPGG